MRFTCRHPLVLAALSPHREPRPADLATNAELERQVAALQQQVASYRSQLALLAPAAAAQARSPSRGALRPHLPPLSSIGAGLPSFPPPASPVVSTRGRMV